MSQTIEDVSGRALELHRNAIVIDGLQINEWGSGFLLRCARAA